MLLIVTALMIEAAPLINHFDLKRDMSAHAFPVYHNDAVTLIISGVGKVRSAMATTWLTANVKADEDSLILVNIGFCGTSRQACPVGQLVLAAKVTDMDTGRDYYPDIRKDNTLPVITLCCHSRPVTINQTAAALTDEDAWCDMESAGFMEAAARFLSAEQILILKVVSDHLEPGRLNKRRLQQLMGEQLPVLARTLEQAASQPANPKPIIPGDINEAVDKIVEKQRFTAAMARQLKLAVRQACLAGNDPMPALRAAMDCEVRQKTEGKRLLASILCEFKN